MRFTDFAKCLSQNDKVRESWVLQNRLCDLICFYLHAHHKFETGKPRISVGSRDPLLELEDAVPHDQRHQEPPPAGHPDQSKGETPQLSFESLDRVQSPASENIFSFQKEGRPEQKKSQ